MSVYKKIYGPHIPPVFRSPAVLGYIRAEPSEIPIIPACLPIKTYHFIENKQPTQQKQSNNSNITIIIIVIACLLFFISLMQ